MGTKGPDVKPLRGTTHLFQPSNESAENPAESSRSPREKAPQLSPGTSLPISNFWLGPNFRFSNPVSVLTPFGRFFTISRDMANCPTVLISARIGSDYHHQLSRYRSGRRHLWQAGTKSRALDVARFYGSRRGQRPTQGSHTL